MMELALDRKIEDLITPSKIRDFLFKQAHLFSKRAEQVNWNIIEDGHSIHNVGLYFTNEFIEYFEKTRPEKINELISAELEYTSKKITKNQLLDIIEDLEAQDDYHLRQIIALREYINYAG